MSSTESHPCQPLWTKGSASKRVVNVLKCGSVNFTRLDVVKVYYRTLWFWFVSSVLQCAHYCFV